MSQQAKTGKLQKLYIEAYSDAKYTQRISDAVSNGQFTAMFNPSKYNLKYEIEYDKKAAAGTSAAAPKFANMKQQELDLEFFLDGTGVGIAMDDGTYDDGIFVDQKVDGFLKLCYNYNGQEHKNNYLRVVWSYLAFDCVLQSADIAFTLFRSDGRPLRARINAKFLGFINDTKRNLTDKSQSPDITHYHVVADKEKLPTLAQKIYGSNQYYLDVANDNGLINFRKMKTGLGLYFKPLSND